MTRKIRIRARFEERTQRLIKCTSVMTSPLTG
uniref:Uncharacterized protein n=1 Tax=Anguilla anguilla TaxID=7936 RepID=A0A0E9VV48_ANGAN